MCKHILIRDFTIDDLSMLADFSARSWDKDGYGTIIRKKSGELFTLKSLDKGDLYLRVGAFASTGTIKEIVVHHRTSTNESGIDYAHPFEFQGTYATHNGVVSVPGTHATRTRNDSEQLLHHLLKTDFDTASVSGYFSVFLLNLETTTVLVDETAPIYSDGRVFCSHDLGGMIPVKKRRIVFDRSGNRTESEIQLTESRYGQEKAHLSIGSAQYEPTDSWGYYTDEVADPIEDFFHYLDASELRELESCRNEKEARRVARSLAWGLGLKLSKREIDLIMAYLGFVDSVFAQA